jgi:putative hydrolase of the HAD superfamily
MQPERRAVVFDLDDTLYPFRRYLVSAFAAVAAQLEAKFGCDRRRTLRILLNASRGPARGHEIQVCLAALGLPDRMVPGLVGLMTAHEPSLRLPAVTARVLDTLRADGWRIGIITNGSPAIQFRKIAALGLAAHVNAVVYATEHGSGRGKPDVEPFVEVGRRLSVMPSRTIVVGDSDECDIAGAIGAGMYAVRCDAWLPRPAIASRARTIVDRLSCVPDVVRALVAEVPHRHVA